MKSLLSVILNTYSVLNFYLIDSFKNEDDFLVVMLLMGALFFLLALIIGTVLILTLMLILFFLISGGVISTSVLVGIHQRSVSKGFKTLFLLISILGSTFVSVIFFWFINSVKGWWETDISIIAGIICGAFSGWVLGLLIFQGTKKLIIFLRNKYSNRLPQNLFK
ncbi:hypothetical protein LZQ00_04100 [Sphingobacterium sp. SRCM116780]|uniref:hypothetical protein n=1 Tax=Sphingobacterium sp. SRCM116780 TaxID=2907623 RepID=UPI001F26DF19|nr:hypothetical protein [Sphingobacterium sp. SRCM116780]UIR57002.1 hypothetical protein LZQ00_04100 [Sphingobacterium sp. SRCM116780]